ncbi:hypothetical protein HGB07_01790 [Candidatus Roizmanbacteria bacterium]|nr:hypothetical protein [Candidatus Roizmanbacteria bacterium]
MLLDSVVQQGNTFFRVSERKGSHQRAASPAFRGGRALVENESKTGRRKKKKGILIRWIPEQVGNDGQGGVHTVEKDPETSSG